MILHSHYLVETEWLEQHLNNPDIRVLDCTVFLEADDRGVRRESGRKSWSQGHIPGSTFADLLGILSDISNPLPLMMPSAEQFTEAMFCYGVGEGTHVILYDQVMQLSASRLWWMLRAFGFDNVSVLNGGWQKWTLEKRRISGDLSRYPHGRFISRPRPGMIADRNEVLRAVEDDDCLIVDALSADQYNGTVARYGRSGHIKSSVNLPARDLVDPETHTYLPAEALRKKCEAIGAFDKKRIITYCGAGPAASSVAFVMTLLGAGNVAVYDGSLSEWAPDPGLPMESSPSQGGSYSGLRSSLNRPRNVMMKTAC